jgi:NIPSNAP
MIFDHRTYTVKVGQMKAHMALYERLGFGPQSKHLGRPLLWATTEVGDVNTYVHIWVYRDLADRTARRAALWADTEWLAYVKASGELGALIAQENKILIGAPFAHAVA